MQYVEHDLITRFVEYIDTDPIRHAFTNYDSQPLLRTYISVAKSRLDFGRSDLVVVGRSIWIA